MRQHSEISRVGSVGSTSCRCGAWSIDGGVASVAEGGEAEDGVRLANHCKSSGWIW